MLVHEMINPKSKGELHRGKQQMFLGWKITAQSGKHEKNNVQQKIQGVFAANPSVARKHMIRKDAICKRDGVKLEKIGREKIDGKTRCNPFLGQ